MAEVEEIQAAATAAGGSVTDIRTNEASLESIFLELTGQQMASPRTAGDTDPTDRAVADRSAAEDSP
jgi:ABC-2 type transport system ATP-binding protein